MGRLTSCRILVAVASLAGVACVRVYRGVQVTSIRPGPTAVTVTSPVKAHLLNGFTAIYLDGVSIDRDTVFGTGTLYDLKLASPMPISWLPLDSVIGLETFRTKVNVGKSIAVSLAATAGGAAAAGLVVAIAIAIECASNPKCFGSCPTFYADTGAGQVLEAEGFSYSIAPLFEARDVDRLRVRADSHGFVRLEVRNEAFETHYINHLELLEIRHGAGEVALPDGQGRPLTIAESSAPSSARDLAGRDLRDELSAPDGRVFRTDARALGQVGPGNVEDRIDLTFPVPPGADSVALVLRLRNSLLNTVLFYDLMLGARGARSLDWMGQELERVGPALSLAQWYATQMGMRVSVWDGAAYREVAHLRDTGPVAWKDLAVVIPVPDVARLRVRLAFVADNWRIDHVALASRLHRPTPTVLRLTSVIGRDQAPDTAALSALQAPDVRYLQTSPGQRFSAEFSAGPAPRDSARTFLLASQGYYVEWVRRAWLNAAPADTTPFVPSEKALLDALGRWRASQSDLEHRFAATRVPVR